MNLSLKLCSWSTAPSPANLIHQQLLACLPACVPAGGYSTGNNAARCILARLGNAYLHSCRMLQCSYRPAQPCWCPPASQRQQWHIDHLRLGVLDQQLDCMCLGQHIILRILYADCTNSLGLHQDFHKVLVTATDCCSRLAHMACEVQCCGARLHTAAV